MFPGEFSAIFFFRGRFPSGKARFSTPGAPRGPLFLRNFPTPFRRAAETTLHALDKKARLFHDDHSYPHSRRMPRRGRPIHILSLKKPCPPSPESFPLFSVFLSWRLHAGAPPRTPAIRTGATGVPVPTRCAARPIIRSNPPTTSWKQAWPPGTAPASTAKGPPTGNATTRTT